MMKLPLFHRRKILDFRIDLIYDKHMKKQQMIRPFNPAVAILGSLCVVFAAALITAIRNIILGTDVSRSVFAVACAVFMLFWFLREILTPCVILSEQSMRIRRFFWTSARRRSVVTDCVDLKNLHKCRYPKKSDLAYCEMQKTGRYGTYVPFEIMFVMKDGQRIPWNVKLYSKKKVRRALSYIEAQTGIACAALVDRPRMDEM